MVGKIYLMIMKDFSKTQKQNILINTKLKNLQMSFNDQDKGNLYLIKEKESVDFELKFPQQRSKQLPPNRKQDQEYIGLLADWIVTCFTVQPEFLRRTEIISFFVQDFETFNRNLLRRSFQTKLNSCLHFHHPNIKLIQLIYPYNILFGLLVTVMAAFFIPFRKCLSICLLYNVLCCT